MSDVEKNNRKKTDEILEERIADNSSVKNIESEESSMEELMVETNGEQTTDIKESAVDSSIELVKQLEIYKDQLLRRSAEFENYKRRTENEISNITKFANEYLISDILTVIDDLERSLVAGKENNNGESFYKGIELIYAKLMKVLEQKGLKVIEALNKPFDVNFHEAMLTMPREDVEPNTVIQELEKGYSLYDKVIRHTKVIVSAESNGG